MKTINLTPEQFATILDALSFYADPDAYEYTEDGTPAVLPIWHDDQFGDRARTAIASMSEHVAAALDEIRIAGAQSSPNTHQQAA